MVVGRIIYRAYSTVTSVAIRIGRLARGVGPAQVWRKTTPTSLPTGNARGSKFQGIDAPPSS
jgi:hypothetical protein